MSSDSEEGDLPVFENLNCNRQERAAGRSRKRKCTQAAQVNGEVLEVVDLTNFDLEVNDDVTNMYSAIHGSFFAELFQPFQSFPNTRSASQRRRLDHCETVDLTSSPRRLESVSRNREDKDSRENIEQQNQTPATDTNENNVPDCPICLQPMRKMTSTFCGHVFCERCIKDCIKTSKKCPKCRKALNYKKIHAIYL